ncbi:alcohol dehydrogenase class IV [Phyllobacterium myrsinacearum]|uniref:Alcohol dehydrogenase 2 n=1 Tax=Phyllobacterium myrsinacearum TaxID=28101 RepID=A0A839ELN2_9HYPH|nr:iron-containing alcohol dehydrogenase [Phyllobacterium myrsinacearum]MBA8877600.1 alcohol dehydrogenase class IV [Phyllobacterium myrsinacearum]
MTSEITSFAFHTTPRIVFAAGASADVASHLRIQPKDRLLIVTDATILALGLAQPAIASLQAAGADITVFGEVEADPSLRTLLSAVEMARENDVNHVLGFGGGSSLDVAKLVALLAGSNENLDEAWGVGNAKGPRLKLTLIPTTAGTGSEVTPVSIITVGGHEKRGVSSPLILPDVALLDPDLTLGLPPHVTAATGIDAMVHAIEAYASKNPNNNPLSRALAVEALRLLGSNIETAVFNGHDKAARSAMLLGSMLAGQAFANSPVAAVHALAYPIGGTFHIPHGLSNALVLPHVLRYNAADSANGAAALYATLAAHTFADMDVTGGTQLICNSFIDRLAGLSAQLGLQTRLRDVGIGESDLAMMATDAMKQGRLLVNNPREVTEADALAIYGMAW